MTVEKKIPLKNFILLSFLYRDIFTNLVLCPGKKKKKTFYKFFILLSKEKD